MRFGVGAFGEIGRRHGLLGCTAEHRALFGEIIYRTDRPGSVPPALIWPPYLAGFALGDHFFLMRTFPDETATRPGMVFTFAVAAPLDEFCAIENLRAVVSALPRTPERNPGDDYAVIEIADAQLAQRPVECRLSQQLAQALVTASSTVVWGSPESFDEVVISLWAASWPSLRRKFSFRLSFDPSDIDPEFPPTLVTSPKQVQARWPRASFIVSSTDPQGVPSDATAVLIGDVRGEPLKSLRDLLNAEITDLRQLGLLGALAQTHQQKHQTFSSLRAELQLTGKLSPSSTDGADFKSSLLDEIAGELPHQTVAAEIRGLRNVPWDCFPTGKTTPLFQHLSDWIAEHIVPNTTSGDAVVPLLNDALTENTQWALSVRTGLQQSFKLEVPETPSAIWVWLSTGLKRHVKDVLGMYLNSPEREVRMADICPDLREDRELSEELIGLSRSKGWFELHAEISSRMMDIQHAVATQLKVLPDV